MVITKEETFGPVAPLYRFQTDAEAKRGQRHPHPNPPPLAGEGREGVRRLFLQPRHRPHLAHRGSPRFGIVGINEGIISTEIAPFGGMKESGIGRPAL
jgi:succinate-semialdehyde dehydrogenase/glutarate-semialdehyde dehydrogenase